MIFKTNRAKEEMPTASCSKQQALSFTSIGGILIYVITSVLLNSSIKLTSPFQLISKQHMTNSLPTLALILVGGLILVYSVVGLVATLSRRRLARQVFIRGNVPMVESDDLLSGNLFSIVRKPNNLEIIDSLHGRLGKTFGLFFGPDPWVLTTDLELIYRIFSSEGNKHTDVTQYRLPYLAEMTNSLAQVRGDAWWSARRILNPSFTAHQMKSDNVYRDIELCCSRTIESIQAHPITTPTTGARSEKGQRVVDIQYALQKFAAAVILRVAYGQDNVIDMRPGAQDELIEAVRAGAKVALSPVVCASIIFGGRLQRLLGLLTPFTAIGKYLRRIHALVDDSFRGRLIGVAGSQGAKKLPQADHGGRRMIDTLIESAKSGKMDEATLRANLFFFFIAGFDTTANTLTCLLWLLAKNQPIQERLRSSLASEEGGERSQYLDWCVKETLRLYPAVPTAIGRVLSEDLTCGPSTFFQGTTVNASIFSVHRSREHWGDDVLEFRPDRFDRGPERSSRLHPAQFMPFAMGPRACIGQNLAMAEMKALASRLLLRYKLELDTDSSQELRFSSTNLIHMIFEGPINLRFTEISSL